MTIAPLVWKTVINGTHKVARTHFGTEYAVLKNVNTGRWSAIVTVPRIAGIYGGTETLSADKTFNQAVKAAKDDYVANGGR